MPDRIEPCLALLQDKPPVGPQWAYEVKWDGYRLAVHIEPSGIRLVTRGGHDWTDRFPAIAEAAKALNVGTAILDGEAVVLDADGRPDFGALQRSLGGRSGRRASVEAMLYAFDLLYFDGHDLTGMELDGRRHLLADLIGDSQGPVRFSDTIEGDGEALLQAASDHGLEGIIAKHRDSAYRSGRMGDWLKIKCIQRDSFVIAGYQPSTSARGGIASLLLAAWYNDEFVHVGNVGTGFSQAAANRLRKMLDTLKTRRPSIAIDIEGAVFVQPTLIAEIEYRAWTDEGKLRHAVYKGLREIQDHASIYRIDQDLQG